MQACNECGCKHIVCQECGYYPWDSHDDEIESLKEQLKELTYYKDQWRSIGGASNLKELVKKAESYCPHAKDCIKNYGEKR